MKHLNYMASKLPEKFKKFVTISKGKRKNGHKVLLRIQSDPVGKVGVNGIQASNLISMAYNLIESLDSVYPNKYNKATLISLYEALEFQNRRTADREARGVEGKNEA